MYKVLNTIWILVLLGMLGITFAQEQEVEKGSCDPGKVQVKIINADSVVCIDEDTAESWIESDFAVVFDGEPEQEPKQQEPEQQEPEQQEPEQQEPEQQEPEQQEPEQQEPEQQEPEQQEPRQQEPRQQEPEQEIDSESGSEVSSEAVREDPCDPGKVKVKIINADRVICVEEDTAVLWIKGNFAVALDGKSEQETENKSDSEVSPEKAGGNPCDSEEVWVKIITAGTVTCVDKDTANSWIESDFAVVFDGKLGERLEQQEPEQQEPEQQESEQQEPEQQEPEQQESEQQKSEQNEPKQESESSSEISSEMVGESPCDPGEVQIKLINAGSVRCVDKDTADLWIEGDFAVAFDGKSEQEPRQQESEQETESESSSEISSEMVGESPCDPGEVQIKLINAGSVRCVDKDIADSWIEGNFAVAFDEKSEQEPNRQEPEQQEPKQQESEQQESKEEAESKSGDETNSETVGEVSCDSDKVRVKIINADSVVCVDEDTAKSWIESDFAVKF